MRPGGWERREKERHLERVAARADTGRQKIVAVVREAEELLGPRARPTWRADVARADAKSVTFAARYGLRVEELETRCGVNPNLSFDDLEARVAAWIEILEKRPPRRGK